MENLFAYGTLMCEDIMKDVAGCHLSSTPAILEGYSRRCVRGELYPALLPDNQGRVNGLLYLNVPDSAWARLDRFEGEMYLRQPVRIDLNDGSTLQAATYVAKPESMGLLDPPDWDFSEFLQSDKARFRSEYRGFARRDAGYGYD